MPLQACGYRSDLLKSDFTFGDNQTAPLVGFAQLPADFRSSCVAVISADRNSLRSSVEACRALGAPIVFVCVDSDLQWWKQGTEAAEYLDSIAAAEIAPFFERHQEKFSPDVVYRAKTWGRFQEQYQLSFVDLGLMPLVEEQVGKSLGTLIERNVDELKRFLSWRDVNVDEGRWLLETVFWLISGKILRDKRVTSFEDLDLVDVEEVFSRVGKHYGKKPLVAGSKKKLEGLREAAHRISRFSSLVLTTTEALAYVYENTMITKQTRSELSTHSTPSFLVDYVVGNLAEWVADIPVHDRHVYEPACGHAAFLVSAMRLLTELLPAEESIPSKRGPYLRNRLHGTDIDSFALELARLSLTLTDIPNPDGWDLKADDIFLGDRLEQQAKRSTILLANPPFDNFTPHQQKDYRQRSSELKFSNKSAEMLWRTLGHLPEGSVFGVVLPQTLLHTNSAQELRKFIISNYELREICLFPDRVFSFSDAESAVLIGRRRCSDGQNNVRYRHVRERDLEAFQSGSKTSPPRVVPQSHFSNLDSYSLRIPDLEEVWLACGGNPTLADVATVGRGIDYKPPGPSSVTYSADRFSDGQRGFARFDRGVQLHELPEIYWLNLDSAVIYRPGAGATCGRPQVLLNTAPVSRGPWRFKALIDKNGRPLTKRFIAVRPSPSSSVEMLWAVLNSPVANAYAFSHFGKRDNIVTDIRNIPIPHVTASPKVEAAVEEYITAASAQENVTKLQKLLLRIDAAVLDLYSLPTPLETALLQLFTGWQRLGVPFKQTHYLPDELSGKVRLSDFIGFEKNWASTNRERGILIQKQVSGLLNPEERVRLDTLQAYAAYYLDETVPPPTRILDELESKLFGGARRREPTQ